ncbi:alpha/beta fold hydrolase [Desmospora profundinema]|uniref:Pimeloyl-ACP methyl ester carboxylesterase n=1 Tax=Desmospora profundinema TaxID=1571184 RepID=A0ABU1IPI7_9BACL|nr:alpha/beta hydrolase [Desmospora profundinema]MDR6225670.1 pimeloyl-ACP methyl ester carboxylesterase [Desmospora profundinema]
MKVARVDLGVIHYSDQGTGQPIVFLHGLLINGNTWRKVTKKISNHYRCIVPHLPLGAHTHPFKRAADLSPLGIADILKQFLDELDLKEVILVGNDTGGAFAQAFTMCHPERVSKLVLCNSDAFEIFPPNHFSFLKIGVKVPGFTFLMAQSFRFKPFVKSSLVLGLLSHTLTKELIYQLYLRHFVENKGVRSDFVKVINGISSDITLQAAQKLSYFDKPVLIIWGTDDKKLFPIELGKRVSGIFPNACFEPVEDSLTYVQEDQPEKFVEKLLGFLEKTSVEHIS